MDLVLSSPLSDFIARTALGPVTTQLVYQNPQVKREEEQFPSPFEVLVFGMIINMSFNKRLTSML